MEKKRDIILAVLFPGESALRDRGGNSATERFNNKRDVGRHRFLSVYAALYVYVRDYSRTYETFSKGLWKKELRRYTNDAIETLRNCRCGNLIYKNFAYHC